MVVAGLQKLSLVDFPGKLAAVIFLQGCNFKCGYCQNPDLIPASGNSLVSVEEVLEYLAGRKNKIDGVVITGGEPTIHKDLEGLLKKIAPLGLQIKLDTNGSNPMALKSLLATGLISYVAVDIKTSFGKYDLLSGCEGSSREVLRSVKICLSSETQYEFRTTCVPGVVDMEDFRLIGEKIKGARKYCLQQFRPGITYDPEFSKVKPFSSKEASSFADVLSKYAEQVEMRGF